MAATAPGAVSPSAPGKLPPVLRAFDALVAAGRAIAVLRGHDLTLPPVMEGPTYFPTATFECRKCRRYVVVTILKDEYPIGGSAATERCAPRPSTPIEEREEQPQRSDFTTEAVGAARGYVQPDGDQWESKW